MKEGCWNEDTWVEIVPLKSLSFNFSVCSFCMPQNHVPIVPVSSLFDRSTETSDLGPACASAAGIWPVILLKLRSKDASADSWPISGGMVPPSPHRVNCKLVSLVTQVCARAA